MISGTGLSIRACVNVQTRTRLSEFEHFCPVPICFGVTREFMQHSLEVYGVLKDAFSNFSSEGYLDFPLLPFGLSSPVFETSCRSPTLECCLAPSCGFPQKPFPPKGPHGFRGHLRRSGMRASEDGASTAPPCYAACNAPAKRSDGALPTHFTSALGTHTVAAALKRANAL